jgi:hypothetical protein
MQFIPVCRSANRTPDRVDMDFQTAESDSPVELPNKVDHFRVDQRILPA